MSARSRPSLLHVALVVTGCVSIAGCYTQIRHAEPKVVYAEEEERVPDPHEGLEIPVPPLEVSVDRPSYWISQGDPVIVTIENLGDEPAILEGRGDLPDIYLEEWLEGAWRFSTILAHQSRDLSGLSTPPFLGPREATSHVFVFDRWGRFRVGVKQLTGDSSSDLIVRSEPFEVWQ
jgi:hypothetical protein